MRKKTERALPDPKIDPLKNLLKVIHSACEDIKASNIVVLDLRKKTSFTDYLVIASATNTRQVNAIANHVREKVGHQFKKKPIGTEGLESGLWVLMDYGDVVCHIFLEEIRTFYRLEELWYDAKQVKI